MELLRICDFQYMGFLIHDPGEAVKLFRPTRNAHCTSDGLSLNSHNGETVVSWLCALLTASMLFLCIVSSMFSIDGRSSS